MKDPATDPVGRRDGGLCMEGVSLASVAERFGTPVYVYSRSAIESRFDAFIGAFDDLPGYLCCYAVKANANLAVLDVLARRGAGFDIVSGGELARVLRAGGDPRRVVFSGVAKSAADIGAALDAGIACFNVESHAELDRIAAIAAARGRIAPIAVRVNPDVDAQSHPYISTGLRENKFGVDMASARVLYARAEDMPSVQVAGIGCHIGSQLTSLAPMVDALTRVTALADELLASGIALEHIDVGGGLGVRYRDEAPPGIDSYAAAVRGCIGDRPLKLLTEPGRAIVAEAGVLLTRVEYCKHNGERHFALVDAGMNDLLRPALYGAWMAIDPVQEAPHQDTGSIDVVGPVCESADFLGKERRIAAAAGDLLAVRGAGAYAFAMSSNYNTRPRPAEVMVDGDTAFLVRARENLGDLMRGELALPPRVR